MNHESIKQNAALSGKCGENLQWYYLDGSLFIAGTGALDLVWESLDFGYDPAVDRSPAWYLEKVRSLFPARYPWYSVMDDIRCVVIGDGCTEIKRDSFCHHKNLREIYLPATLTQIGWGAFSFCEKLEEITIPGGVREIPMETFAGCVSLHTVCLPESIRKIDTRAFIACVKLERINLPGGLEVIEDYAFNGCIGLESVTLPEGLKKIGEAAFAPGAKIQKIIVPGSVETVGSNAFSCIKQVLYQE